MHYESLGLNHKEIEGDFLPDKYFEVGSTGTAIQAIASSSDGSRIYLGSHHGFYVSTDAGKHWNRHDQGLFVQDVRTLAVVPDSPTIYAGTSGGVFKSDDGGISWPEWFDAASGLSSPTINHLAIHPGDSDTLLAATDGGIYHSDDAGESWSPLLIDDDNPAHRIIFSGNDPQTIYVLMAKGIYRSLNAGKHWEDVWSDMLPPLDVMISLKSDPEFLYGGSAEGLHRTFNAGRNWLKSKEKDLRPLKHIIADPDNIAKLHAITDRRILHSTNGGDDWKVLDLDWKALGLSFAPELTSFHSISKGAPLLLAGSNQGLFISSDAGESWIHPPIKGNGMHSKPLVRKMDMVKFITELHTGRYFGSYFVLLVDLATLGLVGLVFSGIAILLFKAKKKQTAKQLQSTSKDSEEVWEDIHEKVEDLSIESMEVHDMIEHIGQHLEKCKSVYLTKEKKEIDEIGRHITTLDRKMHYLMERIGEFEKISKN